MMSSRHYYEEYLEINPNFESVVDLKADERNSQLWREYIVGEDMENLLEVLCQSLNSEAPDARRSFWMHGSYGTGKSYAAIVVKHLLEEPLSVVEAYLGNGRLSSKRNRFLQLRERGEYLVIWQTGCNSIRDGSALLLQAENAVREALYTRFGDQADYGEASLMNAVRMQLNNPAHNWEYIIRTTTLGDAYISAEELRRKVEAGDMEAIRQTATVIREQGWALIDSLDTFKKWIAQIIASNGLAQGGIFFIWDEFTEYVTNSTDHTILQQLSEFAKEQPFYLMLIVHRAQEMLNTMGKDRYQKISDRFHQVEFHITTDAAYDLIAGSISVRPNMREHWGTARKNNVNKMRHFVANMESVDEGIAERLDVLCPIHPMTIKLLSRVADSFAAAQRTMFRFMKDQERPDLGFAGYIHHYGPDDEACWLTPDWLWDYFFTRNSDFNDKSRVVDYIHHYQDKLRLVENSENALRVFKTALLLMAIMSDVKGFYGGRRTQDGISATVKCLENCLAGVLDRVKVQDILKTLEENHLLTLDEARNGDIHLQLPYIIASDMDLKIKTEELNKKYTRYQLFAKDGELSKAFEAQALDQNDVMSKRLKIAVCCAETISIKSRLEEVQKELNRAPYKLGLLIVTVQDEKQAMSIQKELQDRVEELAEPRLVIALCRTPFTDDMRSRWIECTARAEMAKAAGVTGDEKQKNQEAQLIVTSWVSEANTLGRLTAWNMTPQHGLQEFNNCYGMAQLRKKIQVGVRDEVFPYAPENIIITETAYKPCNAPAAEAGVTRKSGNSQIKSVLNSIQNAAGFNVQTLPEMMSLSGSKSAESLAALAQCLQEEIERGNGMIFMDDLWQKLKSAPYGYYDCIVCGVLLGYGMVPFQAMGYTWMDSANTPHILADKTLGTLVFNLCKGKTTSDSLFAGTKAWQQFREYLKKIFGLADEQLAEQISGRRNLRELITKCGFPFWTLKYLPPEIGLSEDNQRVAEEIIDKIQWFIAHEDNDETVMSDTVQLFKGQAKLRNILADVFQDRERMTDAFRDFLYQQSPELQTITAKLKIQPQHLSDRLHKAMNSAVYTWTEEQVAEKLAYITSEYQYLDALGTATGEVYHNSEEAKNALTIRFNHLGIPLSAIEQDSAVWYPALNILYRVSQNGLPEMNAEVCAQDIDLLARYGVYANDCLIDGKTVFAQLLEKRGITCTTEELNTVYTSICEILRCNSSLSEFESALQSQLDNMNAARNRISLQERWHTLTGTDSVSKWCNNNQMPLLILVSHELRQALNTLIEVQQNCSTTVSAVENALGELQKDTILQSLDLSILDQGFLHAIGDEFRDIWETERKRIITQTKLELGNDMSQWEPSCFAFLRQLLQKERQERARAQKLSNTQSVVQVMPEQDLRMRVQSFLEQHPEFCDAFLQ